MAARVTSSRPMVPSSGVRLAASERTHSRPALRERPHVAYRVVRDVTEIHTSFDKVRNEETLKKDGYIHLNKNRLAQTYLSFNGHSQQVPHLAHGLAAVVKKSGLYSLKTGDRFNFTPFLAKIHQPEEIEWSAIPPFVNSSRDKARSGHPTHFDQ